VVRADQPIEHVLTDVSEMVLRHLAQREACRAGIDQPRA
jgi:hypothetical protein